MDKAVYVYQLITSKNDTKGNPRQMIMIYEVSSEAKCIMVCDGYGMEAEYKNLLNQNGLNSLPSLPSIHVDPKTFKELYSDYRKQKVKPLQDMLVSDMKPNQN